MITKFLVFLFLLVQVSFSQNLVNITGTVKNSLTKEPVSDAIVRLSVSKLTTTTDASGDFNISGTSIRQNISKNNRKSVVSEAKPLMFLQETDGSAVIRIFDLSGRYQATLFSGTLENGVWQINPPKLSPGIYLYVFDTPQSRYTARFLLSETSSVSSRGTLKKLQKNTTESINISAKINNDLSVIDTIVVEKSGFRSSHIPINSYNQSDIEILLEDTSGTFIDEATIIPDPSWTCFMPDGIPPPQLGTTVFEITLQYSALHDVGITKFGQRYQYDIKSGKVTGGRLNADVLTGGLDYELILSNGSIEVEQINILRTNDNIPILMRNAGVAPAGEKQVRMVLDFEAPNSSSYTWLNSGKFAATRKIDSVSKTITLEVYDISKVALTDKKIQIKDPTDVPNQTWDCVKISGSKGSSVFTENVSLGSSVSIGASKRGSRNIIPITGGTTSGRVTGKILPGGADYQLSGLDARYTLAPDDGELIIVRNCGSMGALIPVFEARANGPYAFLNENKYLSSDPGMGGGGVTITFYEKR